MDILKTVIEDRKRSLAAVSSAEGAGEGGRGGERPVKRKYLTKAELDAIRERELRGASTPAPPASAPEVPVFTRKNAGEAAAEASTSGETGEDSDGGRARSKTKADPPKDKFQISDEECIRRLRARDEPIRLFGESDAERRLRLRALQLSEDRQGGGQTNEFKRALEGYERGLDLKAAVGAAEGTKRDTDADASSAEPASDASPAQSLLHQGLVPVDVSLVKSDPHKLYPQIYHVLKRYLREWGEALDARPETVKRTTAGKMAAATQQTSATYLKPLFQALRRRNLEPDVLLAIAEITSNMQKREYLKANDAYLRLSIGNAPWPIGVTMVGIHERSGREKIFSNNVAHVLNDETSRKYIQSLKRLLTFAQTKYPPDDLSQRMG